MSNAEQNVKSRYDRSNLVKETESNCNDTGIYCIAQKFNTGDASWEITLFHPDP